MKTESEMIESLSYPDFIAFINQPNSPPGGTETIKKWASMSDLRKESYILDLACSTGFTSQTVSKLVGCKGKGIDISARAIEKAKSIAIQEDLPLEYLTADATQMPFAKNEFTHVLAGCNFSFIQNREKALGESSFVLKRKGKLCVSNFYYHKTPSPRLLTQVENVIGFRPSEFWTLEWWTDFFKMQFNLIDDENKDLLFMKTEAVENEVYNFIYNESKNLRMKNNIIRDICFERLLQIRLILNEHRLYQKYNISVWEPK